MSDPKKNNSKYEEFLDKSQKDGESVYLDSKEDLEKMESMNEISIEVKRDYEEKQTKSQVYASQVVLR